jgi:hypothetical protein
VVSLALLAGGCQSGKPQSSGSSDLGTPEQVMTKIVEAANSKLPADQKLGETLGHEVTSDSAQGDAGLSAENFQANVTAGWAATAAINVNAQTTVLLQAKDSKAAQQVAEQVASGFDSHKWICVLPEESTVAWTGTYVLLVVGGAADNKALVDAFGQITDSSPQTNRFFTSADQGGGLQFGGGDAPADQDGQDTPADQPSLDAPPN